MATSSCKPPGQSGEIVRGKDPQQAFKADCRLPDRVSWLSKLGELLYDFLDSAPDCDAHHHQTSSVHAAHDAHTAQLRVNVSRRAPTYSSIKEGYNCEPYTLTGVTTSIWDAPLRRFRTGSHWLHIKTGRHKKLHKYRPIGPHKCANPGRPEIRSDRLRLR